ncbi:MAG: DNA polymerase III subunit gamma/tau [Candidatus Berkelbacteria bacterium Licking1014_85]|uniref:DNA polymerase III subunit gamma/tau n=1 Tax=Candidatus Berkelbacteria bacterium Licking1014_85 TaxID=2017148 RepID=A0A554LHG3_9BACT|nr:MAG: DNA polymerase III subunit gamma/tau [Candidatus Berkelbacteria bacterium Licking1014_85]
MYQKFLDHISGHSFTHAYLIEGKDFNLDLVADEVINRLKCQAGDSQIYLLENISIKDIRALANWFYLFPVGKHKIALIDYQKLSLDGSHALLKILEEPPKYGIIILFAFDRRLVLPTILSRCQVFRLKKNNQKMESEYDICEIVKMNLSQKFEISKKISESDDFFGALDSWINCINNNNKSSHGVKTLEKLFEIKKRASTSNASRRLLLDELLITLKSL